MKPMRVTTGFRDFVLDQLAAIDGIAARRMFGGLGLYAGDVFFGILAADVVYFKVDETSRRDYDAAGMPGFTPYADGSMSRSYSEVPLAVVEDADVFATWARRAIAVARRAL